MKTTIKSSLFYSYKLFAWENKPNVYFMIILKITYDAEP